MLPMTDAKLRCARDNLVRVIAELSNVRKQKYRDVVLPGLGWRGQVFVISEKSVICHRNDPAQSCQDGLDHG